MALSSPSTDNCPRVALTMGDVAGVGPEVIARAWSDPTLHRLCQPLVIGDPEVLRKAIALVSSQAEVVVDRTARACRAFEPRGALPHAYVHWTTSAR